MYVYMNRGKTHLLRTFRPTPPYHSFSHSKQQIKCDCDSDCDIDNVPNEAVLSTPDVTIMFVHA